jgi:hypothetical protein
MDRVIWEVVPDGADWKVFREGVRVLRKPDRQACIDYAQREAKNEWEVFDLPSRLTIRDQKRESEEVTDFGADADAATPSPATTEGDQK